jgi:hypothetical protein
VRIIRGFRNGALMRSLSKSGVLYEGTTDLVSCHHVRIADAHHPIIGVNGQRLISADTPSNIFFFIASWRPVKE